MEVRICWQGVGNNGSVDNIPMFIAMAKDKSSHFRLMGFGHRWVAHWQEMISDPSLRIGRPRQLYVGATRRDYLGVGKRG